MVEEWVRMVQWQITEEETHQGKSMSCQTRTSTDLEFLASRISCSAYYIARLSLKLPAVVVDICDLDTYCE
jgi:hypothetical protein